MSDALRQVIAKISADLSPLKKGLDEGDQKVNGFTKTLAKMGGALAAAFAGRAVFDFTRDLISTADATAKTADSLNMGIVELQGWQHAAELSGLNTELLTASVSKLTLQLFEATTKGTGPAAEALSELNLEAERSPGKLKSAGDIIGEIADKYVALNDKAEIAPQLMKLFGEQGLKLVPLLKGGSAGIAAMRAEVEELGFAFDEDFARGAEAFDDNLDRLNKGFKGLVIQGLGPMLPDLIEMTDAMVKSAKAFIPMVRGAVRFVRESKLLQAALSVLSVKGLMVVAKGVMSWVKGLGGLRGVMMRVLPLVWKFVAPLLILEDIFVFLAGGKSKTGDLLEKAFGKGTSDKVRELVGEVAGFIKMFKTAPDEVRRSFDDLPGDLKRILGPFGEFVGELGQGFIESFLFATDMMTGGWENFANKGLALGQWLKSGLDIVWTELKFAGLSAASGISDEFSSTWNSIIEGARRALKAIAKVTAQIPLMGSAARKVEQLADKVNGYKRDENAGKRVSEQWDAARLAISRDIESAKSKAYAPPPSSSQNVSQHVENNNTVQVNVPPGTDSTMANRVGAAAARGTQQGGKLNLRATRDALAPRPAG